MACELEATHTDVFRLEQGPKKKQYIEEMHRPSIIKPATHPTDVALGSRCVATRRTHCVELPTPQSRCTVGRRPYRTCVEFSSLNF
jgi:hypothetical protein